MSDASVRHTKIDEEITLVETDPPTIGRNGKPRSLHELSAKENILKATAAAEKLSLKARDHLVYKAATTDEAKTTVELKATVESKVTDDHKATGKSNSTHTPNKTSTDDNVSMISQTTDGGSDVQIYRVTLGATAYNQDRSENCFECDFFIPGIPDPKRMKRALYYFDIALFMQGLHREKLLNTTFEATRTGGMYAAMADAYVQFSSMIDDDNTIFIAKVEKMFDVPLLLPTIPLVRRLHAAPKPIKYNLRHCISCLRVEELDANHTGAFTCVHCKRLSRSTSSK